MERRLLRVVTTLFTLVVSASALAQGPDRDSAADPDLAAAARVFDRGRRPEAVAGERQDIGVSALSVPIDPIGTGSRLRLASPARPKAVFQPESTTLSTCGDERDDIVQEYVDSNLSTVPTCDHFTADRSSPNFTFAEMNSGDHRWAWIEADLLDGLENTRRRYGAPMTITSGYRCPERNEMVGGVRNSRHQFGDTVDVSAETREEQRDLIRAATRSGARKVLGYPRYRRHVHLEW